MDYGKSAKAKSTKGTPKHLEHNEKGTRKNPFGAAPAKAELLERMKAAAQARASETKPKE